MKLRIYLVCLLSTAQTISALGGCVEVPGQSLTSVTLDLRVSVPSSGHVAVHCDANDRQKSCVCSAVQLGYLGDTHRSFTFNMQSNLEGKNGYLKGPDAKGVGDVGVEIRCGSYKTGGLTPNLAMLQDFLAADPAMLKSCTFTNRAKYPDEIKQANVAQSKDGHGNNDADRKLIVDALNQANGDPSQAAKRLGISEKALRRKILEYKIQPTYQ